MWNPDKPANGPFYNVVRMTFRRENSRSASRPRSLFRPFRLRRFSQDARDARANSDGMGSARVRQKVHVLHIGHIFRVDRSARGPAAVQVIPPLNAIGRANSDYS